MAETLGGFHQLQSVLLQNTSGETNPPNIFISLSVSPSVYWTSGVICVSVQDEYPLASLPLLGYSITIPSESENIHKDYVFKLHFKSHVYYFRSESEYTFERHVTHHGSYLLTHLNVKLYFKPVFSLVSDVTGGWRWFAVPPALPATRVPFAKNHTSTDQRERESRRHTNTHRP